MTLLSNLNFEVFILIIGLYFINNKRYLLIFAGSVILIQLFLLIIEVSISKTLISLLITSIFILIYYMDRKRIIDVNGLFIMLLIGSLILIISDDLISIYVGLELQTFSSLVLISNGRSSLRNSEAGLKYFTLGSLSSGLFLLGMSLIYFYSGELNISNLGELKYNNTNNLWQVLLFLSLFFKLSIFPVHFWVPDVYEAIDYDFLALIGSIPKISIIILLIKLSTTLQFFTWCGIFSIIVGTLGAINQSKIKRLLAYSGISQMGFIVICIAVLIKSNLQIAFLYSLIYFISLVCILGLLSGFIRFLSKNLFLSELSGFQNINPLLTTSFFIIVLSIGGLPPLMGFISKWFIISNIILNDYLLTGLVVIIFSGIAIFYYIRIGRVLYFQNSSSYLSWSSALESKYGEDINISSGIFIYSILFIVLNVSWLLLLLDYLVINL